MLLNREYTRFRFMARARGDRPGPPGTDRSFRLPIEPLAPAPPHTRASPAFSIYTKIERPQAQRAPPRARPSGGASATAAPRASRRGLACRVGSRRFARPWRPHLSPRATLSNVPKLVSPSVLAAAPVHHATARPRSVRVCPDLCLSAVKGTGVDNARAVHSQHPTTRRYGAVPTRASWHPAACVPLIRQADDVVAVALNHLAATLGAGAVLRGCALHASKGRCAR